jgi:hypothetical protein
MQAHVSFRRPARTPRGDLFPMSSNAPSDQRSKTTVAVAGAVFLSCLTVGFVTAQSAGRPLESPKAVGSVLYTGTQEILLVAPSVRSKEVADGLRRAATERGTPIFILADARFIEERAGYLPGLSLVKNVQIRLLRGVQTSQAIVDRKLLISGPLLFDIANPLETKPTEALTETRRVNAAINWFAGAWKAAKPYTYRPPNTKP